MTHRLILAALACATVTGVAAMGSFMPAREPGPTWTPGRAAFACAFTAREAGGSVAIEARLEAREAVSGSYALRLRRAGADLGSSGDFMAGAGESLVLSSTRMSGSTDGLDAELTLTAGGRTTTCPLRVL